MSYGSETVAAHSHKPPCSFASGSKFLSSLASPGVLLASQAKRLHLDMRYDNTTWNKQKGPRMEPSRVHSAANQPLWRYNWGGCLQIGKPRNQVVALPLPLSTQAKRHIPTRQTSYFVVFMPEVICAGYAQSVKSSNMPLFKGSLERQI